MGKGRNKRHNKRRREQSRKAKREQKKQKKTQEKWRKPKTPKKRKKSKGTRMPMFNSKNVQFIHVGMSGRFLIEPKYGKHIAQFKKWHEDGVISEISFLVFGDFNSKTRLRLYGLLKSNGHEWAINHLIFKMPREFDVSFLIKRARCLKMTHYVDMNKDHISTVVMSDLYGRVNLFLWNEDAELGWADFKLWLKKHNPLHFDLYEQGEKAADIIQTGLYAKKERPLELIEIHTSHGYESDSEYDKDDASWGL